MHLDDRAQRAAQDLRSRYEVTPIPPLPTPRAVLRRAPFRAIALAGGLAVTATAAVGVLVLRPDGGGEPVGNEPQDTAPAAPAAPVNAPAHLGLRSIPSGWRLEATAGQRGFDGDTDGARRLTVFETPVGTVIGVVEPINDESPVNPVVGTTAEIAGLQVTIGPYTDGFPGVQAQWTQASPGPPSKPLAVNLVSADPDAALETIVAQVALDSDGFLAATGPGVSVASRGDIAPFFLVLAVAASDSAPADSLVEYRSAEESEPPPGFSVRILRQRPSSMPIAEAFVDLIGGESTAIELFGAPGRRGWIPDVVQGGADPKQFALAQIGADLVGISSVGVDAETFDRLLAEVGELSDAEWQALVAQQPVDADAATATASRAPEREHAYGLAAGEQTSVRAVTGEENTSGSTVVLGFPDSAGLSSDLTVGPVTVKVAAEGFIDVSVAPGAEFGAASSFTYGVGAPGGEVERWEVMTVLIGASDQAGRLPGNSTASLGSLMPAQAWFASASGRPWMTVHGDTQTIGICLHPAHTCTEAVSDAVAVAIDSETGMMAFAAAAPAVSFELRPEGPAQFEVAPLVVQSANSFSAVLMAGFEWWRGARVVALDADGEEVAVSAPLDW